MHDVLDSHAECRFVLPMRVQLASTWCCVPLLLRLRAQRLRTNHLSMDCMEGCKLSGGALGGLTWHREGGLREVLLRRRRFPAEPALACYGLGEASFRPNLLGFRSWRLSSVTRGAKHLGHGRKLRVQVLLKLSILVSWRLLRSTKDGFRWFSWVLWLHHGVSRLAREWV